VSSFASPRLLRLGVTARLFNCSPLFASISDDTTNWANWHIFWLIAQLYSTNVNHSRLTIRYEMLLKDHSGGSRAAAAVADGCREVVAMSSSGGCSLSACISATTIPVDTWPPISSGSAWPLGYLRAETPREKDPQTLMRRDCPRWQGFPLGESEQGQTRAQLTQSTPTRALLRPQHSVPQIY